MASSKPARDALPEAFATIEEAATFWDTHSIADYWAETERVHFDVDLQRRHYLVALTPDIITRVMVAAQKQGVSAETLINLWLSEKLYTVET